MDTPDFPVCRSSIITADLLTQPHSQSRCLILQQGLFAKRWMVCGEQGVEFLFWTHVSNTNSCRNGYTWRNLLWVAHFLWQSTSLSVYKSFSTEMNLYWVSRCYYKYYTHINPGSLKEISTDCQQKIHQSNRISLVLKETWFISTGTSSWHTTLLHGARQVIRLGC